MKTLENSVESADSRCRNSFSRAGSASACSGSRRATLRIARCRRMRRCEIVAASRWASSSCDSRTICSVPLRTSRNTKKTVSATLARINAALARARRTFSERRLNVSLAVRMHAFRYDRESSASAPCEMCEFAAIAPRRRDRLVAITQPALSNALRALEAEFGVT